MTHLEVVISLMGTPAFFSLLLVRIGWRWLLKIVAGSWEITFGIEKIEGVDTKNFSKSGKQATSYIPTAPACHCCWH